MNKGIARATGDVIGFINADDFFPSPHSLALVADAFERSGADACYGDLCYVREDDITQVARYWRSCDYRPGFFERGWCPPHPTFYVRREVYQRLGGFDLSFRIAADVALMARFLAVEGISSHHIPEVLVHMRLGGTTNRSFQNIWTQNREVARALKKLGLRFSWLRFGLHKLLSRAGQFVLRPGKPKA
jgi:glycosyltransferase involved in cell wall biosynthesis